MNHHPRFDFFPKEAMNTPMTNFSTWCIMSNLSHTEEAEDDAFSQPPWRDPDGPRPEDRPKMQPCEFAKELASKNPYVPWDRLLHEPIPHIDFSSSEKKNWEEKKISILAACRNRDLILHHTVDDHYYYFTRSGNEDEMYDLGCQPHESLIQIWTDPHISHFQKVPLE